MLTNLIAVAKAPAASIAYTSSPKLSTELDMILTLASLPAVAR